MIIPASDDRLVALARAYITATRRFEESPHLYDADDDLHDQIAFAESALLALLPPVVAPRCEVHDKMTTGNCPQCSMLEIAVKQEAIGAALARLGLRAPWGPSARLKPRAGRR